MSTQPFHYIYASLWKDVKEEKKQPIRAKFCCSTPSYGKSHNNFEKVHSICLWIRDLLMKVDVGSVVPRNSFTMLTAYFSHAGHWFWWSMQLCLKSISTYFSNLLRIQSVFLHHLNGNRTTNVWFCESMPKCYRRNRGLK